MDDSELSDSTSDCTESSELVEENMGRGFILSDSDEDEYFTEKGQRILKINSIEYNRRLNNEIAFPFDYIGMAERRKPILDLLERQMKKSVWCCDNFKEHTETGQLKNMPIESGTIHRALVLHNYKLLHNLYEIKGQLVGIAQSDPLLPVRQGNEVTLLVRDPVRRDPVIQVIQPFYLQTKIPEVFVGQIVKCVGKLMEAHRMQAIRVTVEGFVHTQSQLL